MKLSKHIVIRHIRTTSAIIGSLCRWLLPVAPIGHALTSEFYILLAGREYIILFFR